MSDLPNVRVDLPVALVRLWAQDETWLRQIGTVLAGSDRPPLHPVEEGLFAVLPESGDPSVIEAAISMTRSLLSQAPSATAPQALIFPGRVALDEQEIEIIPSPLLNDLEAQKPELREQKVNLTSHALYELESDWTSQKVAIYRGPSGRELPIFQLESVTRGKPWRNAELVGRRTTFVERSSLERAFANQLESPCLLVHGAIGCGKTRLIDHGLRNNRYFYAKPWKRRTGGPTLAKQLLDQIYLLRTDLALPDIDPSEFQRGSSGWFTSSSNEELCNEILIEALARAQGGEPLLIVIDEMEAASAMDLAMIQKVLELTNLGSGFRVVLSGRSSADFLEAATDHPRLKVPPFEDHEMSAHCESLFEDLNMPEGIESQLFEMCKGFPFALEEALIQMVRHKSLRRVYGNYFFSGLPNAEVGASARLTRHLEGENLRLGSPLCLRILSHADISFFADQVAAVATTLGQPPDNSWELPYVESGLIEQVPSSMGDSLSLTCPLHGLALARTVTESSVDILRHLVGREIAAIGDETSDHWKAYELLAGTPDASSVLIQAAKAARSTADHIRASEALVEELHAHHERMGDPDAELAMLWVLLPLARRLGKLGQLQEAIDRAVQLAEGQPDKMIALSALRADVEQNQGRLREAELLLLEGLSLAHENDDRRKAVLFVQLGRVLQRQGRHAEARKLFEDVLEVLERTGGTALAATCQFHLGNIALHEGRFETAIDMHEEALKERRRRKLTHQVGASLSALGAIHLALGEYPRSLLYYREAEEILERHGREGEVSFALQGVGRTLSRLGDFQEAAVAFKRSLQLRQARDDKTGEAIARLLVADNFLNLEHNELALEEARKAHFTLSMGDSTAHLGDAEQLLGRIRLKQRHFEDSRQHLDAAINIHQQHGDIMAATFDRAWLLETSIAVSDHRRIEELCSALEAVLETLRYPELGETLDLRLYQGLEWLRQRGRQVDPLKALRRGYRELYRKTELLSAELRNAFLFQIPDNRAIVNAATLHGLTLD